MSTCSPSEIQSHYELLFAASEEDPLVRELILPGQGHRQLMHVRVFDRLHTRAVEKDEPQNIRVVALGEFHPRLVPESAVMRHQHFVAIAVIQAQHFVRLAGE